MNKTLSWSAFILSLIALALSVWFLLSNNSTQPENPTTTNSVSNNVSNDVTEINAPENQAITEPTATDTTTTTTTIEDNTLGLAVDYPTTWVVSELPPISSDISHSGIKLSGPEGEVQIFNSTGFGGGLCSDYGLTAMTLSTQAGDIKICNGIDAEGHEKWHSDYAGSPFTNGLILSGYEMNIFVQASANPPLATSSDVVSGILKSLRFIPIE